MLVLAARIDHHHGVGVVGVHRKQSVNHGWTAKVAFLYAVVAYVVVLFADVGHRVSLVHPGEVGLVARQPALKGGRVRQRDQVLVSLVGRALANLGRRGGRQRRANAAQFR